MGNKKSKMISTPTSELQKTMGKTEDVLHKSLKLFNLGREQYKMKNLCEAHRYYELSILYLQYVQYFSEEKYQKDLHEVICNVAKHMVMTMKEYKEKILNEKVIKRPIFPVEEDLIPWLKNEFGFKQMNPDNQMLFSSILSCISLDRKFIDWSDIIGNNSAKEALMMLAEKEINPRLINLIQKKELTRESGVLLLGPPGCGKTVMAKAVASHVGGKVNFIDIAADSLKGKYVGESEKLLSFLFKIARAISPCIIFLGKKISANIIFFILTVFRTFFISVNIKMFTFPDVFFRTIFPVFFYYFFFFFCR